MAYVTTPTNERVDVPRREGRLVVRVDVIPHAQIVPPGLLARHGVNDVVIYESDYKKLEGLLEDDTESLRMAERAHESQYRLWINEKITDGYEKEQRGEIDRQFNRDTYGGSLSQAFRELTARNIKPLRSVDILAELPPPPRQPEHAQAVTGHWIEVQGFLDDAAYDAARRQIEGESKPSGSKSSKRAAG